MDAIQLDVPTMLALLVEDGLVSRKDADSMYTGSRTKERAEAHPLTLIANQRWQSMETPSRQLTIDVLMQWLADKHHLEYINIDPLKVDVPSVCAVVSHAYATRYKILPVALTRTEITIATANPYDLDWERALSQAISLRIKRVLANPEDIIRYLAEFYSLQRSLKGATKTQSGSGAGVASFEQLVELGKTSSLDANDQHVVHIVDWLFQYAYEQRASDIHLEPRRDSGNIRFRIDGMMHLVYQIPVSVMSAVVSRIKLLGRMDIVEKRRPQDGRIKTKTPDGQEVELRLSTMPTVFGEKLVMRIFDPDVLSKSYRELGFTDEEMTIWNGLITQPNGIVLLTGPTGSGKTTTLYTTMRQLAQPEVNVCTIEDPIENVMPQLNQMQVQPQIGLNFADGVRTLLRQDPDIIMIGEIRDRETAEMAIQAALTGHLVLSTLHTNDAPSAVTRLLEIGVPGYLLNATLLGVVAQRLVRTLCPHCKAEHDISDETWSELVKPWRSAKPAKIYKPVGCLECRMTGYYGRTGIYEMLAVGPTLRKLIGQEMDIVTLRQAAIKHGMKPLRLSAAMKAAAGQTTVDEVLTVTPPALPED
ncbi:general secretion pathway protein E [Chitinivorax tropicus]|uniref:General secretion pathway protein E n=1 Tax=Chitinivorax tropicus TaxID=714531 RepID=A0A840MRP4_9PROT|nr:GspE/PulE family protein [Chitinivorax tropicus]MBB5019106.1 general secretion pathway protein E [Chitinivorax tropicus]